MMEYVINNSETIGTAVVALVIVIYAIITKEWAVFKAAAYSLMLSAEGLMSTEEGAKKMEAIFKATWQQIPKWSKVFITETAFRTRLQEWYRIARDQLTL